MQGGLELLILPLYYFESKFRYVGTCLEVDLLSGRGRQTRNSGSSRLQNKFKADVGYLRPCLKSNNSSNNNNNNNSKQTKNLVSFSLYYVQTPGNTK